MMSNARGSADGRRTVPLLLLAMLAAAAGTLSCQPGHAPGASDRLAGLDALRAYTMGVDLLNHQRRAAESLPYFRRALALRPDLWQCHCDYAAALLNASVESRSSLGMKRSATRSSWERAAMTQEALAELDRAEQLTRAPADRAHVIALRAQTLAVWGLSWNGLAEYERAHGVDSSAALRQRGALLWRTMCDPQATGR